MSSVESSAKDKTYYRDEGINKWLIVIPAALVIGAAYYGAPASPIWGEQLQIAVGFLGTAVFLALIVSMLMEGNRYKHSHK